LNLDVEAVANRFNV